MACGSYEAGRCGLPAPVADLSYTPAAAGERRTVLLRSDGGAVACGSDEKVGATSQCDRRPEPRARCRWTLPRGLLRSDGGAGACELNEEASVTSCRRPPAWAMRRLPPGRATQCCSGATAARDLGSNEKGRFDLPAPVANLSYVQAPAGGRHTVLLGSGGGAVACGLNEEGQHGLEGPAALLSYTRAAAGARHTLPRRSAGGAVACGSNEELLCDLPAPGADVSYAQAAAGGRRAALPSCDGSVMP